MADLNIPDAPPIEGATHLHSGKVRDLYRLAVRRPADGRQRPDLGVRLRPRHHDPRQGRGADPDVAVVVRAARRPGAQPRRLHRRARTPSAVGPWCARSLDMFPVECVARGYLTGSGLLDYRATGEVCGIALPDGLEDGSRLPRADLHARHQGRARRPRRERLVRRGGRRGRRRRRGRAARPDPRGLRPRRGDRPRPRDHPGRHQARVRPRRATGRSCSATRC